MPQLKKLIVINTPFRKVGKSDFDSLTIAKRTGVKANKKES